MSSSDSDSSRLLLPIETVEQIIDQAWSSELSNAERTRLFCTFCLVNRTWLNTFIPLALKNVYIPSSAFAEHYERLFRQRTKGESDNDYMLDGASKIANESCRSITFCIESGFSSPSSSASMLFNNNTNNGGPHTISNLFYMVSRLNYLPNLRRVRIEYEGASSDDVFINGRLIDLPGQVTHLELKCTLGSHQFSRRLAPRDCNLANVRKLSLIGVPSYYPLSLAAICPKLEHLEIVDLCTVVPVLRGATFERLVLPSTEVSWSPALKLCFEDGMFSGLSTRGRITLQVSNIGAQKRTDLKKLCEDFDVDLIFIDI